jgi:ribonucleotide reductase alpha subunit
VQYSDHEEYAVCNLASIAINKCIQNFDYIGEWIIYIQQDCIYCNYVKLYLSNNNVSFIEKSDLNEIKDNIKILTYPQIFHNNNYIGGWNELYNYTAGIFDYDELYNISYLATINLNNVIDINYYPVPQTKKSKMKHRPIGLGIQ